MQLFMIVASNFHISAIYGSIEFCFGYDALVGLCYHNSKAHDPINWSRGPLLRERLLRGHLLIGRLNTMSVKRMSLKRTSYSMSVGAELHEVEPMFFEN